MIMCFSGNGRHFCEGYKPASDMLHNGHSVISYSHVLVHEGHCSSGVALLERRKWCLSVCVCVYTTETAEPYYYIVYAAQYIAVSKYRSIQNETKCYRSD